MAENFYIRLKDYYLQVGKVLRQEAGTSTIFPNSTDIGVSRERIYAEFLKQHLPSKCNVMFGGFLFHKNGQESKQLDIIINTDTTPRFDFNNKDGSGKTFSPVEGTLAIVSVKSKLDKKQLYDALDGIASIPPTESLEKRITGFVNIKDYEDWPYKIIYASDGLNGETLLKHCDEYYLENPNIPISRRPNIIHVAGKYYIMKVGIEMELLDKKTKKQEVYNSEIGSFSLMHDTESDLQAIIWSIYNIQINCTASNHILFNYAWLINQINNFI
ncbi:hypothetical protein ASG38_14940 [Flavobacterium sp. Leaf359]|uniref:DUF6602 domain-containing protein n=1 Tax=Flavobacterium sp. Leaf359 TaxID=1736351 RepID=UPI000701D551|nr:DUF6602 domain-containing protein [Flavobacterium sp. Leaf359]KQS45904.1 hypothetical protein ASG38_14940 [Flavobacterium sp. Leaf359]